MIPLYTRIQFLIRNKIVSGQYEPGKKLLKEQELAAHFGVSKITVRNALSHLEKEGLILRKQGKGTFVSENIPLSKQFIISGGIRNIVLDAARYEVKAFDVETIKLEETRVARDVQSFFSASSKEKVGWVRRIRLLKGVPIWYLENFIPLHIVEYLNKEELSEKPLLKILKEKIGLTIGRGEMFLEAVPAESEIAKHLRCETFDPLIHIQVYYWLPSGEPFEAANAYLRGDYFKYKVDLTAEGFESI
jgi:GntR family transcriptional regulator